MEKYKVKDDFSTYLSKKDFVSSSDLTHLAKSPKHYFDNLQKEDEEETKAQYLGTAIHLLILEPSKFHSQYITFDREKVLPFPDKDYKTKANREARDLFYLQSANQGLKVLDGDEYEKIIGMGSSLTENETFMALLQGCETETSHYLEDIELGLNIRLRPDAYNPIRHNMISLKSTKNGSPDGYSKECVNYGLHYKEAFYSYYMAMFYGKPLASHSIAVVENFEPYNCAIYDLSEEFLEVGRHYFKTYLHRLVTAREKGIYEGYSFFAEEGNQGIITLELPAYVKRNLVI